MYVRTYVVIIVREARCGDCGFSALTMPDTQQNRQDTRLCFVISLLVRIVGVAVDCCDSAIERFHSGPACYVTAVLAHIKQQSVARA